MTEEIYKRNSVFLFIFQFIIALTWLLLAGSLELISIPRRVAALSPGYDAWSQRREIFFYFSKYFFLSIYPWIEAGWLLVIGLAAQPQ